MRLIRQVAWLLLAMTAVVTSGNAVTSERKGVTSTTTTTEATVELGNVTKSTDDDEDDDDDDDDDYYYYDNDEEVTSEVPTTQGYEPKTADPKTVDSKLLFSYVVPAKKEEGPKPRDKEEDAQDVEESMEEEHSEGVRDEDEYEEEEEDDRLHRIEDDEDGPQRIEEVDDEDEEEDGHLKEEDEDEPKTVAADVKNEEDEEETGWDASGHSTKEDHDDVEQEEEEVEEPGGDVAQRRNLESEELEEEEEEVEDDGPTRPPIVSWRQSSPPPLRSQPRYDFTTAHPARDTRPVSYSSVVFDPDGNSKAEQSGSFYKKPLKVSPSSGVFPRGDGSESDTRTVPVTTDPAPGTQQPDKDTDDDNDDDEEDLYEEPEAVTSNVRYAIEEKQPGTYPWARQTPTTAATTTTTAMTTSSTTASVPPVRPNFGWLSQLVDDDKTNVEGDTVTKRYPSDVTVAKYYATEFEEPEPTRSTPRGDMILVGFPKTSREDPRLRVAAADTEESYNDDDVAVEPTTKTEAEDLEEFDDEPRKEQTRQEYHDRSNRENYYEQTINTRFRSKENDESEVRDLSRAEPVEEWKDESVNSDVEAAEEVTEEAPPPPTRKDRNQLYEYVIDDGAWQENKEPEPVTDVTTTSTTTSTTTAGPTSTPAPVRHAKPKAYAFGSITRPRHGDSFRTFKNTEDDDVIYNQIVSNIQSLFTPPKPKPTEDYEQRFFPSHNCQQTSRSPPDSINYETFIQPSQTEASISDGEEDEDDDDENNPMPMSKRLPVRMYRVHPPRPPPHRRVKVAVYPRRVDTRPASYRSAVHVPGPVPSQNKLVRKVVYYRGPSAERKSVLHLSPTNQVLRVVRPLRGPVPSGRMLIIRKLQ